MRRLSLVLLLVLLILPSANAVLLGFNTTHGGLSNPSDIPSDYNFTSGCNNAGTIVYNSYTNTSNLYATGGSGTYQYSDCEVNLTPSGNGQTLQLISGRLARQVGVGIACDFKMIAYAASHDDPAGVGFTAVSTVYDYGATGCTLNANPYAGTCGGNQDKVFPISSTAAFPGTLRMGYNVWQNFTFILNSTSVSTMCLNNSDACSVETGASYSALVNISIMNAGNGPATKFGFKDQRCYDVKRGAPQSAIVLDTTPPTSDSTALNNTSPKKNFNVNPSAKFTDETSLSSIWAAHNLSGTFANFSSQNFTGTVTTGNFSPNITNTLSRGNVVGFRFTANDTSGNSIQSAIFTYSVSDTLGTILLGINNTSPKINEIVNVSVNCTDIDSDFSLITISHNQSGNPQTNTSFNIASSGINPNVSQSVTISLGRGKVVNFTGFCNDTLNTQYQTSSKLTIVNTAPTNATILYPTESLLISDTSIDINITYPSDVDSDTLTAYFYINGTLNSTSTGNSSLNASDGKYNLTIALSDGVYLANTTLSSFKIDITNPTDNISNSGLNGVFFNANTTRIVTASDTNLYGHNVSLYSQNGNLIVSHETINIATTTNSFLVHINMTYGDGNYTLFTNESDDHTAKSIPDYVLIKDDSNKRLSFTTDYGVVNITILNAYAYDSIEKNNEVGMNDKFIKVNSNKNIDRYSFEFNYTKPSAAKNYFEYEIEIQSKNILYPRNSQYSGHFVTSGNWLDFEPSTIVNSTRIDDYRYILRIGVNTSDTKLNSIGGINKGGSSVSFSIDTTAPSITSLLNQTLQNASINLSAIISDIYLNNGNFSHNASGSWVNYSFSSIGNTTYGFIIPRSEIALDREVYWRIYAYDSIGNEIQSSLSSFTINSVSAPPIATPSGGGAGGGGILGRCDPYAKAYNTCYYFKDNTCIKGCPSDFICNKEELRCVESIHINKTTIESNIIPTTQSLWSKFKTFVGTLFDTQPIGLQAIPIQEKTSQTTPKTESVSESKPISSLPADAPIQKILANPIQALIFVGIIGTIFAGISLQWLLIAPPTVYFLIAYWALVALLWKFKVFGG